MEEQRIEATVSGRVQRVMYRDFATRMARRLGLRGTVRNLPDGTVRVVAEGRGLERYVELLRRGPLLARVDDVAVVWGAPQGAYRSFTITYG